MIRLMKYPGAKGSLLPEIDRIFMSSGASRFVDVFGGSGLVSLNIQASSTVYNDLDPRLYNLFKSISISPEEVYRCLYRKYTDLKRSSKGEKESDKIPQSIRVRNIHKSRKVDFFNSLECDVDSACSLILEHTLSFGGMGGTYATNEKSPLNYLAKTLRYFSQISESVQNWTLECLDFRDLIAKYNARDTFLFMDPPYLGKKWYDSNLSYDDFSDLKELTENITGTYLIVIDREDSSAISLLGEPSFTLEYKGKPGKVRNMRRIAFYSNVNANG